MELAICLLGDNDFYGLDNHYIIHHSVSYSSISTPQRIRSMNVYIKTVLDPNLIWSKRKAQLEIIRKILVCDKEGDIYNCAIYYTYLLRIIQRRWRKKMELRKNIYNNPLFINYLKKREMTNKYMGLVRDTGINGLFYGNLVVNM